MFSFSYSHFFFCVDFAKAGYPCFQTRNLIVLYMEIKAGYPCPQIGNLISLYCT